MSESPADRRSAEMRMDAESRGKHGVREDIDELRGRLVALVDGGGGGGDAEALLLEKIAQSKAKLRDAEESREAELNPAPAAPDYGPSGMARRIEEGVRGPLGALEEDAHAADRRRRAVAGALLRELELRATEAPGEFTTEQQLKKQRKAIMSAAIIGTPPTKILA